MRSEPVRERLLLMNEVGSPAAAKVGNNGYCLKCSIER